MQEPQQISMARIRQPWQGTGAWVNGNSDPQLR